MGPALGSPGASSHRDMVGAHYGRLWVVVGEDAEEHRGEDSTAPEGERSIEDGDRDGERSRDKITKIVGADAAQCSPFSFARARPLYARSAGPISPYRGARTPPRPLPGLQFEKRGIESEKKRAPRSECAPSFFQFNSFETVGRSIADWRSSFSRPLCVAPSPLPGLPPPADRR